ncbi:hypothetical protein ABZ896_30545 [Streptomyces sp. NPDC047072]
MRRPQVRVTVNSRCKRSCYYCRPSGEAVATAPQWTYATGQIYPVGAAL